MGRRFRTWTILFVMICIVLPGCGPKNKKQGVVPTLKTIMITPDQSVVFPGEKLTLTVKGLDQNGKEMSGLTFAWKVEKPDSVEEDDVS